jgi:hypothetical protein
VIARRLCILFVVGVLAVASSIQQILDAQPDRLADANSFDDVDTSAIETDLQPIAIQGNVISHGTAQLLGRDHVASVFRPPRSLAVP